MEDEMFVIAGATGQVGGVTARTMLDKGEPVRLIIRDPIKARAWSEQGAEVAIGTLDDEMFLTQALSDATGFFTLLPADYASTDFYADQRRLADAIVAGVERSDVAHVVLLSSHGAELPDGTGPVKCLHHLENRLRETDAQLTAVRSGYRQENLATVLGPAREHGIVPSLLPPDAPLRMVAAADVGRQGAEALIAPADDDETIDVQGLWYTMREATDRLSTALGQPLQVAEVPRAGWFDAFAQAGMTAHLAEIFIEMYSALADGRFVPAGDRLIEATTPIDDTMTSFIRN
jgi:uncharacterized protein YbjT (DUF2867 family)